jgi:hypothetical protein
LFLISNQKKNNKKGIGIPIVMCRTNDDAISNGNKCNNVIKERKCFKKEKRKQKRRK